MSRTAMPLQLHMIDNKSKLTPEVIAARAEAEKAMQFGDKNFKIPPSVKKNKIAKGKWNFIIGLLKEYKIEFITTSDVCVIERYCLTYAEYKELINLKELIIKESKKNGLGDIEIFDILKNKNIDFSICKKLTLLNAMEDRLFLNPVAKLKNIPKHIKEKKLSEEESELFGE